MCDDQITRQRQFIRSSITRVSTGMNNPITTLAPTQAAVKQISWDEIQKRRAQGLCFDCNDKFTLGQKYQAPQLMILENLTINDAATSGTTLKKFKESSGDTCLRKMPLGNPPKCFSSNFPIWSLRTSIHLKGWALISTGDHCGRPSPIHVTWADKTISPAQSNSLPLLSQ